MKVSFWSIGKTEEKYLAEGIGHYVKRLGMYLSFEYKELPAPKLPKNAPPQLQKEAERDLVLKGLKPTDTLILLDDKGQQYTSEAFAAFLEKTFARGGGGLVFLCGGAFGFHEEVYKRAQGKLSLSPMTFTHQMVRLIFLEQLYRGMTILRGEPYHHG